MKRKTKFVQWDLSEWTEMRRAIMDAGEAVLDAEVEGRAISHGLPFTFTWSGRVYEAAVWIEMLRSGGRWTEHVAVGREFEREVIASVSGRCYLRDESTMR